MKPVAQTAVATIQQVGRKFSSAYASNNRNGICRVVGSVGSVPSIVSQQKKQQSSMAATPRTQLIRFTQHVVAVAAAQSREKSSMSIDYDGSEASATKTTANATYDQSVREPFPSIVVGPEKSIEPQGSFAEAQAQVRKFPFFRTKRIKYRQSRWQDPNECNRNGWFATSLLKASGWERTKFVRE